MPLRLRVIPRAVEKAGEGQVAPTERIVEFADELDEIRIGRRSDAELSLPFKALSGLHARLLRKRTASGERGSAWLLEDLDSKNGTFVGKSRLKPGEQRLMFAGDNVDLGPVNLFFDGHAPASSGAEGTGTIARRLVNDLFMASPGAGAPTLSVISGAEDVQTLKLLDRDRPYIIGRAKSCDMYFPFDELSRQHASFTRTWNGIVLKDQGSKNGILVNGILVTSQRLSDGDEIEMGPLKLRLMDPEERYLREIEHPDRAEQRAPRGDAGPKPVVVMPAALAVSLPPTPAPPPPAPDPTSGSTGAPRKVSRLAPRPSTAAPGAAPPPALRTTLDEHHPAIAARRPPADPQQQDDRTMVRRAHKTMYFAVAVLVAIVAAGLVLFLGNFFDAEP